MADELTPSAAPAPAQDGGADPALELPGGTPASADPDPNANPANPDDAPAANPPAAAPAAGDPADPNAKPQGNAAMRFEELTRKARQLEQQARESDRRLQQALSALERVAPQPTAAPVPQEEQEPDAPVFETPEQYQREMAEYSRKLIELNTKRLLKAQRADDERARVESEQQAFQNRVRETFAQGRAQAIEEISDFVEVAESPEVHITAPMAVAIVLLENRNKGYGTKVQYYLGKNPAEAARIAQLPLAEQSLELGMLVPKAIAALAPKAPARTQAPAPIRPLAGGATPASKSLDEMSMEEYAAYRSKR